MVMVQLVAYYFSLTAVWNVLQSQAYDITLPLSLFYTHTHTHTHTETHTDTHTHIHKVLGNIWLYQPLQTSTRWSSLNCLGNDYFLNPSSQKNTEVCFASQMFPRVSAFHWKFYWTFPCVKASYLKWWTLFFPFSMYSCFHTNSQRTALISYMTNHQFPYFFL